VTFVASSPVVSRITFGRDQAVTAIKSITFQP
jgi:hypothetical protein